MAPSLLARPHAQMKCGAYMVLSVEFPVAGLTDSKTNIIRKK